MAASPIPAADILISKAAKFPMSFELVRQQTAPLAPRGHAEKGPTADEGRGVWIVEVDAWASKRSFGISKGRSTGESMLGHFPCSLLGRQVASIRFHSK